jgi:hypothetical protein
MPECLLLLEDAFEDRWQQHQVDELRIELRASSRCDHVGRCFRATTLAVSASMRDGIEGVGQRDDARGKRDLTTA